MNMIHKIFYPNTYNAPILKRLIIIPLLCFFTSCHYNIGHRLGGDIITTYPENTVECLSELLSNYRSKSNLRYVEFDVQEVSDSNLYVFHDKTINRVVPIRKFGNDAVLQHMAENSERIEFKKLSSKEVEQLNLSSDSIKIPTLEAVLGKSKELNFKGKIYIEVKNIVTNRARTDFMETLTKYSTELDLYVLVTPDNFKKVFPDTVAWCNEFNKRAIPVIEVKWHCTICETEKLPMIQP